MGVDAPLFHRGVPVLTIGGVVRSCKGRRMLYRFTFLRKSKIKELSGVFGNSRGIYKQVVFQHLLC